MSTRTATVLDRFPRHLALTDPGKRFGEVVDALAADLDVVTRQVGEVRKAHRVGEAETRADLLGLAALHGFAVAAFELVRLRSTALATLAEATPVDADAVGGLVNVPAGELTELGDALAAVTAGPARHRRRMAVERTVLLGAIGAHCTGNATPAALLRAAAAYLGLDDVEVAHTEDRWWHLALCRDAMRLLVPPGPAPDPEAPPPPPPPDLTPLVDVLALEENPFRTADLDPVARRHGQRFRILRGGLEDVDVAVRVLGIGLRTVRPMVVHLDTGRGLVFEGDVPDGAELVFGVSGRVTLSGSDVTGSAWAFAGGVFASATEALIGHDFRFTADDGTVPAGTLGPPATFSVATPVADAFDTAAGLPHGAAGVGPLRLPLGESRWAAFVRVAHHGATPAEPAVPRPWEGRFDQSVFGETGGIPDPSLAVGFAWDEREPFAVRVLIPRRFEVLDDEAGTKVRQPLRVLLDRHRAAGVDLRVEYADPRWTLGTGVVRADEDDPLGVVLSGTELWPDEPPNP